MIQSLSRWTISVWHIDTEWWGDIGWGELFNISVIDGNVIYITSHISPWTDHEIDTLTTGVDASPQHPRAGGCIQTIANWHVMYCPLLILRLLPTPLAGYTRAWSCWGAWITKSTRGYNPEISLQMYHLATNPGSAKLIIPQLLWRPRKDFGGGEHAPSNVCWWDLCPVTDPSGPRTKASHTSHPWDTHTDNLIRENWSSSHQPRYIISALGACNIPYPLTFSPCLTPSGHFYPHLPPQVLCITSLPTTPASYIYM